MSRTARSLTRPLRLAALMAVVLALFIQGTAQAASTITVNVVNDAFQPMAAKAKPGDTIHWAWNGNNHSSTGPSSSPITWDSGVHSGHTFTFDKLFKYSGTFNYICSVHAAQGMVGTIAVAVLASPASGAAGTQFKITFGSATLTGTNFQAMIEIKPPGGAFGPLTTATTGKSINWDSTGMASGVWQFRVSLKNTATSKTSGVSPARKVTVT